MEELDFDVTLDEVVNEDECIETEETESTEAGVDDGEAEPVAEPVFVVEPKKKRTRRVKQENDVDASDLKKASTEKKPKKIKPKKDIRTVFHQTLRGIEIERLKKPWMAQKAFRLIDNAEDLQAWVDSILSDPSRHHQFGNETCPVVAVDTETTGLDTRIIVGWDWEDQESPLGIVKVKVPIYEVKIDISGICLSADGVEGIYIPITHEIGNNIDRVECSRILQQLFDKSHLVFYHAKYDREVLRLTMGINFRPYPHFEDVQVLAYLNDPKADLGDKKKGFTGESGGLKALSKNVLGIEQIELDELGRVKCEFCPKTDSPFCSCTDEMKTGIKHTSRCPKTGAAKCKCSKDEKKEVNHEICPKTDSYECTCTEEEKTGVKHSQKLAYVPFSWIPTEYALWYAAGDALTTWLLWQRMHGLARSRKLVHKIDHELVDSLTWIERQRFHIDTERLARTVKGHQKKCAEMRVKLREMALEAGFKERGDDEGNVPEDEQFNPGSTLQLQELLYKVKGFKVTKVTSAGNASCDAEVLEDLHKLYPDDKFLTLLLSYRDYMALHPENLSYDPNDHTARMYLKPCVVAGGRLAGGGGNFAKDGGFGLNPQGIKKVESYLMWKVKGNVLTPDPDEINDADIEEHNEEDLHPSCFKEKEKEVIVGYKEPEGEDSFELEPTIITLTSEERLLADKLGRERNDKSERDGRKADWYDTKGGSTTENHQDGVAAEMCHTRLLGKSLDDFEERYFRIDTFKEADWGRNTEVRGTKMRDWAGKVKDRDVDSRIVIFYRKLDNRQFQVLGWLTVAEAKKVGERRDPGERGRPAIFVRDRQLHPIDTLPEDCGKPQVSVKRPENAVPITEKRKVKSKAPGIVNNHIGKYLGYSVCLVPGCTSCAEKYGILIPDAKIDANEVINLRCLFVAPEGWTYFCVDYSNIEMRCAANVSGEPEFINEFLIGSGDFHSLTASKVFPEFTDPKTDKATRKSFRDLAKIINFALLYGGTAYTIFENMKKKNPNITFDECVKMVEKYWEGVPVFFEFCSKKQGIAKREMICTTATGRVINFQSAMEANHIHVPTEEEMDNYWDYRKYIKLSDQCKKDGDTDGYNRYRGQADRLWQDPETGVRNAMNHNKFIGKIQRVSVNVPLQGLAGDFMRMALNRIRKWVDSDPEISQVFHLHGSVHDEIDFTVKNEYAPFIMPRITRLMKLRKMHEKMGWKVPIESDSEYGSSWDVDHHLTGDADHKPAAYTEIKGADKYIPDLEDFTVDTVRALLKALNSGEEARIQKAEKYLRDNTHPRSHVAIDHLMKATDAKERKKFLIANLQLHEFWTIDAVPDGEDSKLETLAQYEKRVGLTKENRGFAPSFGFLGAIPLEERVRRPEIPKLGEWVAPTPVEMEVVATREVPSGELNFIGCGEAQAIIDSIPQAVASTEIVPLEVEETEVVAEKVKTPSVTVTINDKEAIRVAQESVSPELIPVRTPEPKQEPQEEDVFAEEPRRVSRPIAPPSDGIAEVAALDLHAAARFKTALGVGGKTLVFRYRGRVYNHTGVGVDKVPDEFLIR